MESFYGLHRTSSENNSSQPFEVNNYGYFKSVEKDIVTKRFHGREDFQLVFVKQGEVVFYKDGKQTRLYSGGLLLYYPHEPQYYKYCAGKDSEYFWFHFSGTEALRTVEQLFMEKSTIDVGHGHPITHAMTDLKAFCTPDDAPSKDYANGRFIMMLAQLKRLALASNPPLERLLARLSEEKFDEGSNTEYAEFCRMSEAQFLRQFKAYTGLSPHKYKTAHILRHARELLEATDMNISEIANALGISDSLYFSRLFKKQYGLPPLAYRKTQSATTNLSPQNAMKERV